MGSYCNIPDYMQATSSLQREVLLAHQLLLPSGDPHHAFRNCYRAPNTQARLKLHQVPVCLSALSPPENRVLFIGRASARGSWFRYLSKIWADACAGRCWVAMLEEQSLIFRGLTPLKLKTAQGWSKKLFRKFLQIYRHTF